MPTYNIGACGCCGSTTFKLDLYRVEFTNVGFDAVDSYTCDGVVAYGVITYPDSSTENVTGTFFFDNSTSGCGGIGPLSRTYNNVQYHTVDTTLGPNAHGATAQASVWYPYIGKYDDYVAEGNPIMSTNFVQVQ